MKRLSYIDEHAISVAASRDDTWPALLGTMCRDPDDPTTVPIGFALEEARAPEHFALKGRHLFATYRWVFELDEQAPQRTRVRAATWADFPGLHGKIYRAAVIGTRSHRVVTRWTLKRIAARAMAGPMTTAQDAADYVDVFEAQTQQTDSRTAEQAFRDALEQTPGPLRAVVEWILRHVLGARLGPFSSPEHVAGWSITRSDTDEIVLEADGLLMRGQLELRRQDGRRAVLTTRLHYRRKVAARLVWAIVGPVHRTVARQLVKRIARAGI